MILLRPMLGGVVSAPVLVLVVFPAVFYVWRVSGLPGAAKWPKAIAAIPGGAHPNGAGA